MCSSGSRECVVKREAVFDDSIVEHICNNSSRNALSIIALNTIVLHCATLDIAVGDFSVTRETRGDTTRTTVTVLVIDGHVLHAKAGNGTCDDTEETCIGWGTDCTILDNVSAAVVVSCKAGIAQRDEGCTLQVNVVSLLDPNIGVLGLLDIFLNRCQVCSIGYLERICFGTQSELIDIRHDRGLELQTIEVVLTIRIKFDGYLIICTQESAYVLLGAIRRTDKDGAKTIDVGGLVIGHHRTVKATVTYYHVVVSLATGAECLCSNGASEVNDAPLVWCFQHEFSTVVIAVGGVFAASVIDIEVGFTLWQRHGEFTLGRYHQIPLGIEIRGSGHQDLARFIIVRTIAVGFGVPTGKIIIVSHRDVVSEIVAGDIVSVVSLEHIHHSRINIFPLIILIIRPEREGNDVRHAVSVHGLCSLGELVNLAIVIGFEYGDVVSLDGLVPDGGFICPIIIHRVVEQVSHFARLEAEVVDVTFGISDVAGTALIVGTQRGAVGKDA